MKNGIMSYPVKTPEARIQRAKGVKFNYLQFLWSRLNMIVKIAEAGDYALALKLLILDIPVLPADLREVFQQYAEIIENGISKIGNYEIPQLQNVPDLFIKQILRDKYLQFYCKEWYEKMITMLFEALEGKGFLWEGEYGVPVGESHTLKKDREISEREIINLRFEEEPEEEPKETD
ncbi:MAG: hypothetical protein DRN49_04325 [Thaumarchaeota archaeon]|nr:MAG: hypothetical protein DRN49_04325 [Nitrososphaerota archaeon]